MIRARFPELVTVAFAAALALAVAAASARAQDGSIRPDLTPEMSELMGAPVFASDGLEVGEVASVAMLGDGTITEIRVTTAFPLGLGSRTIVLPPGCYIALRGAVVMDLPAEAFEALPSAGKAR